MQRIELDCHTKESIGNGIIDPEELMKYADHEGMRAVAITDDRSVQAFPKAYRLLDLLKKENEISEGFKLVYGTEIYIVDDVSGAVIHDEGQDIYSDKGIESLSQISRLFTGNPEAIRNLPVTHAIIWIKTQQGFSHLYHAMTEAAKYFPYDELKMPQSIIDKYREGIIICLAGDNSEIIKAEAEGRKEYLEKVISLFDYVEIQPINNLKNILSNIGYSKTLTDKDLQKVNEEILYTAEQAEKYVIASNNVHYLCQKDELAWRIFQSIEDKDGDEECEKYHDDKRYFMTTQELLDEFKYLGKEKAAQVVIENTNELVDHIEADKPIITDRIFISSEKEKLRNMCYRQAHEVYGSEISKEINARIELELQTIEKNKNENYFLFANDLISKCRLKEYEVDARGMAGSSIVAYLMGFTGIDPVKYNLMPYGFIGTYEEQIPMIMINVPISKLQYVQDEMSSLNGIDSSIYCDDPIRIADDQCEKLIDDYLESHFMDMSKTQRKEIKDHIEDTVIEDKKYPFSKILIPDGIDLNDYTPVRYDEDDIPVTEFDKSYLKQIFPQIHVMGHISNELLSKIAIKTEYDPLNINLNDEEIITLFQPSTKLNEKFGLDGIPEFEGLYVNELISEIAPKNFMQLVVVNCLSHDSWVWDNNQRIMFQSNELDMDEIISSREDVYEQAINYGMEKESAFLLSERIRKGSGFGVDQKRALDGKVPARFISVCGKIRYLYPRAQAITNVIKSIRLAFYKINYPEIFMECVESSKTRI